MNSISEKEGDNSNYAILIVDDMPKNIQLVAKFLTDENYNLFFAQSGAAALKQINSRMFDLILLDVMMPGMDGFEVCEKVKENPETKNIPVIFLTAKTDDEAIAKGFSLGGVDYITKPFNPVELLARVKTHLKLRQREKELRDLNTTKDTLLSVISHDLKTPFFNIMGLGELLLKDFNTYDDASKKEFITNIVDSSRISHSLLDNLLSWTRIQTGKIHCNPSDIVFDEVIEDIFKLVKQQALNKKVELEYLPNTKLLVFADVNMLQTIFRNIITNAIKYTPRGGTVSINTREENNQLIIEVKDTGIGIPPARLEKMFTPSKIPSMPGTENELGSGFGLILTKEFVLQNNGSISVESVEGEGATFRVSLPSNGS